MSVDPVRFRWVEYVEDDEGNEGNEDNEDHKDNEDSEDSEDSEASEDNEGIEDVDLEITPYRTVVTTPVTIWVRVLPDTLNSEEAFRSSNDILDLLEEHGILDVDVAYRESVVRDLRGPDLFASHPSRISNPSSIPSSPSLIPNYCTWPTHCWLEVAQNPGHNGFLL